MKKELQNEKKMKPNVYYNEQVAQKVSPVRDISPKRSTKKTSHSKMSSEKLFNDDEDEILPTIPTELDISFSNTTPLKLVILAINLNELIILAINLNEIELIILAILSKLSCMQK